MKKSIEKILTAIRKIFGTNKLKNNQQIIISQQSKMIDMQNEILKSQIFNSTIIDSEWLKYRSFSPGGWAVDYGFLYTLYRVLNDMKPKNILEFGLGQSSKMIHQYANFYQNANAITCEHDSEWINFFQRGKIGDYSINIKHLNLDEVTYKGEKTLSYKDMPNIFGDDKFDFIVVDAPFGSPRYSRSQIIDLAKYHLNDQFCIIIDDYNRLGEIETGSELIGLFKELNIQVEVTEYLGAKKHLLVCSENLIFLTTM